MVGDAKSRGIRPFLATIPPMDPSGSRGSDCGADLVPGFNDRIRSVAAAENVTLVDVYQAFGGNLALLSADGVHPNTEGYKKIADAFFDAIKSTLEIKRRAARRSQAPIATVCPAERGDGAIEIGLAHEQVVGVVRRHDEDADRRRRQRAKSATIRRG